MPRENWTRRVRLTFGDVELKAAEPKPHELDKAKVGRLIYDRLNEALMHAAGPSLARAIYDALSIKPGVLGVSFDVKALLESLYPTLKDRLNTVRLSQGDFDRLQVFVGDDATSLFVPMDQAKRVLGDNLFTALNDSGVLYTRSDYHCAVFHDLVAKIIFAYR